ncbi:asparagine synthetase [glutamine-hydrolyzing] [Tribolium madens]|uniref:asparagine synthetase [glutamine-hydrolyzing] n=1 Tax=Tribolium madens TaxID=41895 RepID=UPI001CF73FBA|nr:asparagine synthetase [glutamine-hydrolyzing] [Tribolium madens]
MCGIWALFHPQNGNILLKDCTDNVMKIRHRGPDASRVETDKRVTNGCVAFHRLAIVDCIYGMQPMRLHQFPLTLLICNGELYNCKELEKQQGFKYETYCDVECITHLYHKLGIEGCVKHLDGVFAFCLIDMEKQKVFLGRDPYGVRPLFKLTSSDGMLGICSEAKGIIGLAREENGEKKIIKPFTPGTFEEYDLVKTGGVKLVRKHTFHQPGDKPIFQPFVLYEELTHDPLENIRKLLTTAVKKRLMANRRIGCFLSGGLDSSLIASLLVRAAKEVNLPYKIQTFCIGMNDSPDVIAAQEVADFIGTEHHVITFSEEDVARVLDDVIYTLETPDITTIRASIPMYLISRYVLENTDTTVLFSGEGADELCQGYIYFRDAPSPQAGHDDSIRLLKEIYLFDGLRGDRTTSASSLELRLPFLDLQFTHYYLSLDPKLRQPKDGVEKFLIRSAFDKTGVLPDRILWRHKEAFSDGVASKKKSLFQFLQEIVEKRMPEPFDLEVAKKKYPHCTPNSKESLYYREVFEKSFPHAAEKFIPFYWMPRWVEGVTDPSARFIKHYAAPQK